MRTLSSVSKRASQSRGVWREAAGGPDDRDRPDERLQPHGDQLPCDAPGGRRMARVQPKSRRPALRGRSEVRALSGAPSPRARKPTGLPIRGEPHVRNFRPTRRSVLASSAAIGALGLLHGKPVAAAADNAIRPFRVNIPEEQLVDLRRRIAATRWPDRETVNDRSQGIQLAKLQELVRYWGTDYDWRKAEAKLNALPQFMTEIDGLDIHFIHVRSRHRERPAADHDAWLARLGVRAAQDRRSAHGSHVAWRTARRTLSTSFCPRCRATASPASQRARAGIPTASPAPGRS